MYDTINYKENLNSKEKSLDSILGLLGGSLGYFGANYFGVDDLYIMLPIVGTGYNIPRYFSQVIRHKFVDSEKYQFPNFKEDVLFPAIGWSVLGLVGDLSKN